MIFYSDFCVPKNAGGCVRVLLIPIIFIRPKYKDDKGLIEHEKVHVRQAWRNIFPPIHTLRYKLDKDYRLKCEVEAYKEQLDHYPDDRSLLFASFIANDYGLNVSVSEALELLR